MWNQQVDNTVGCEIPHHQKDGFSTLWIMGCLPSINCCRISLDPPQYDTSWDLWSTQSTLNLGLLKFAGIHLVSSDHLWTKGPIGGLFGAPGAPTSPMILCVQSWRPQIDVEMELRSHQAACAAWVIHGVYIYIYLYSSIYIEYTYNHIYIYILYSFYTRLLC